MKITYHENYKAANRETEMRKKLSKQRSWEKICEDLRNDLLGTRKLIYKTAKSCRRESHPPTFAIKDLRDGTLLTESRKIELGWKIYFENLLNVNDINLREEAVLEFHVEESRESNISMGELLGALKKMKNGKASGMDQIPAELVKNMGDVGNEWLLELLLMLRDG